MGTINKYFDDDCIEYKEIKIGKIKTRTNQISNNSNDESDFITDESTEEEIIKIPTINISNLKWFNLKNYSEIDNLDRKHIHNILGQRIDVFDHIDADFNHAIYYFKEYCLDYDFKKVTGVYLFGEKYLSEHEFLNISSISYQELLDQQAIFNSLKANLPEKYKDIDSYHNSNGRYNVSIDVTVSDDLLIDHFKKWLKNIRKKDPVNISKRLSDNDFLKVKKYKIIPYIDLLLWSKLTGNHLTYKEQANLLYFNDPNKDGEYLRNTVKPFAEKLLYADVNLI